MGQAVRLEQFPFAWMVTEVGVAVTVGIAAGSLTLTSSGFDPAIEGVPAVLVLRRLRAELAGCRTGQDAPHRMLRVIAATFFTLAVYMVIDSVVELAGTRLLGVPRQHRSGRSVAAGDAAAGRT